jgi:hypothetical protein
MAGAEQILNDSWALVIDRSYGGEYVLRLRSDLSWVRKQYLRWIGKTTVQDLYESLRSWLASEDGSPFPDGIDRIDLETAKAVERWVPRCYWLKPACHIEKSSLKSLKDGPLFSAGREKLLVHPDSLFIRLWKWIDGHPVRKMLGLLSLISLVVKAFS